jgi:hypothetical protein
VDPTKTLESGIGLFFPAADEWEATSARQFSISVSACRRPVRHTTETGSSAVARVVAPDLAFLLGPGVWQCPKVRDPDDQESPSDRHSSSCSSGGRGAGRAGVGRQRTAAPGGLPAAGKVTRLPRGELERAGDQDDPADRDRNGARQRRQLHLDRRQRDAQRKGGHSEHGPQKVFWKMTFATGLCGIISRYVSPAAMERMRRKIASTDDGNRQMVESKCTSRARMTLQNEKNPSLACCAQWLSG